MIYDPKEQTSRGCGLSGWSYGLGYRNGRVWSRDLTAQTARSARSSPVLVPPATLGIDATVEIEVCPLHNLHRNIHMVRDDYIREQIARSAPLPSGRLYWGGHAPTCM